LSEIEKEIKNPFFTLLSVFKEGFRRLYIIGGGAVGFFGSLILTTWRPLYCPQVGQVWCGIFIVWHWGHSTSVVGLMAVWLSRWSWRDLLFLRFGSAPMFLNSVL
jgi:hypothetical protein